MMNFLGNVLWFLFVKRFQCNAKLCFFFVHSKSFHIFHYLLIGKKLFAYSVISKYAFIFHTHCFSYFSIYLQS